MAQPTKGTSSLLQDIRFTARLARRSPGYVFVIVVVLAIGIGATSLVFSLVNGIVLRPLPYREADRLVGIHGVYHEDKDPPTSPPDFLDWRQQEHAFDQLAAYGNTRLNIAGVDQPESVQGATVSYNFFEMLGVNPIAGHEFDPSDEKPGVGQTVIISYPLWRRMFGSDQSAIGKTLSVNGRSRTVVGVTPAGFELPDGVDLWLPLGFDPQNERRSDHFLHVIGRLKPGLSLKEAQAEMDVIAAGLANQYPATNSGRGTRLSFLYDDVLGKAHLALLVLLGAVCLVLLIACANIASLMLAKASDREKEISLRLALGASRGRIIRQLLTESIVLSTAGGVLGLLLATFGIRAMIQLSPSRLPRLDGVVVDWRVLAVAFFLCILTGILSGLAPAVQSSKADVNAGLKEGARGTTSDNSLFRNALVVVEIALALVLLTGASLLVKSFMRLQNVNPGFRVDGTTTMSMTFPQARYPTAEKVVSFCKEITARLAASPEVDAVGAASQIPMTGIDDRVHFMVDGAPIQVMADRPIAQTRCVIGDYFKAQGISLITGRTFTEQDIGGPPTAVVNRMLAATFFPGESPIGKRILLQFEPQTTREIVGEVDDVRVDGLDIAIRPQIYAPLGSGQAVLPYTTFVVHGRSNSVDLRPAMKEAVAQLDRDQPVFNVKTMEEFLSSTISQQRFNVLLMTLLAILAAVLAAIGIYSIMAYSVSKRTGEIGIRMAMGAQPADVMRQILRRGMAFAAIGVGAGLIGSFAMHGAISSMLYGVTSTDPLVFLSAAIGAFAVAVLACYIPARRATRVDPIVALRRE
jgi:putative ABC transport system permease protein